MKIKNLISLLLTLVISITTFGQTSTAKDLIREGITFHDAGQYKKAIKKYKKAFEIDSTNVLVLYEMGYSSYMLKDYDGTILLCKKAIHRFPDSKTLKQVFTLYANTLDVTGKPREAMDVYDQAISKFPSHYMLHFNKAITAYNLKDYYEARVAFQASAKLNPRHASSVYYLGIIEDIFGNKISAILALSRFMILEPEGDRAQKILPFLTKQVNKLPAKKTGNSNTFTLEINNSRLDTMPNEFQSIEMSMSLLGVLGNALSGIEKKQKKTELQDFSSNFKTIIEMIDGIEKKTEGFNSEYLIPFFTQLEKKNHTTSFTYHINSFENKIKEVKKWIKNNDEDLKKYYSFAGNYSFK
ncbi:MAG: tetratricopeptide repeat protein [Flavobacteriales bacterium]|nr:tetratricopeptide repeat protein [Flavobacteriales bacterium]